VAEQAGIDLMRRRIERASRQPPPPRRAADPQEPAAPAAAAAPQPAAASAKKPEPSQAPTAPTRPARATAERPTRLRLGADVAPVNLAIRVRRPLDDRLADIIHGLRGQGVRTSKVELIEMLLWELPDDQLPAVRERLRQFRDWAPRGTSAPLEAE
jgi:hypothetical protein